MTKQSIIKAIKEVAPKAGFTVVSKEAERKLVVNGVVVNARMSVEKLTKVLDRLTTIEKGSSIEIPIVEPAFPLPVSEDAIAAANKEASIHGVEAMGNVLSILNAGLGNIDVSMAQQAHNVAVGMQTELQVAASVSTAQEAGVQEDRILHNDEDLDAFMNGVVDHAKKQAKEEAARTCIVEGCGKPRITGPVIGGNKPMSYHCHEHHAASVAQVNNTNNEKVESNMKTTVKEKAVAAKVVVEEKTVAVAGKVGSFFKGFKDNKLVKFLNKQASTVWGFIKKHKLAITVGTAATVVGGVVTASSCAAAMVGTAVAGLLVVVGHMLAKKKEERSKRAMFLQAGVAMGAAALAPFVLLALSFTAVYATVLPYAIVVA